MCLVDDDPCISATFSPAGGHLYVVDDHLGGECAVLNPLYDTVSPSPNYIDFFYGIMISLVDIS